MPSLVKYLMKKIAIITAGGIGSRMGASVPKQFLLLNGKPILWHTITAFLHTYSDFYFILVLPKEYLDAGENLIKVLNIADHTSIVIGGDTRFHSVQNALALVNEPSIIFVHDGVRCLVSPELIIRCYEQTLALGSAIPAVASTDSVRIEEGGAHHSIDRNNVKIIQTPQTFLSDIILPAFNQAYNESFTDEASVAEAFGKKVFLIEGDYRNIKITRPIDLQIARIILEAKG